MNPTRLIIAKVTVAVLPQLKTNSLTKRPTVPMARRIKPLSLIASFIDSAN